MVGALWAPPGCPQYFCGGHPRPPVPRTPRGVGAAHDRPAHRPFRTTGRCAQCASRRFRCVPGRATADDAARAGVTRRIRGGQAMTATVPEQMYSSMPGPSVRAVAARTPARDLFPRGGGSVPGEQTLRASLRRAATLSAVAPGESSSFCHAPEVGLSWNRQEVEGSEGLTGDCPNARQRAQQPRDRH